MPETLLRTKLFAPPLRPNLVPRRQLIEKLNSGLSSNLIITDVTFLAKRSVVDRRRFLAYCKCKKGQKL